MTAAASPPVSPVAAAAPQSKEAEDATPLEEEGPSNEDGTSSTSRCDSADREEGEIGGGESSGPPPLPNESVPQADDGWDCLWDPNTQAWFFHNRFTGNTQWENPRAPDPSAADSAVAPSNLPASPAQAAASSSSDALVGGYNPAIHGDYDPTAWYAQKYTQLDESHVIPQIPSLEDEPYLSTAAFNRFTGHFQQPDAGPARHTDEAKSNRQMNAYFDVDAAADADDGRSLKAERSNKRISKSELKAFKEKRRARKEEKRRAWLRD